MKTEILEPTFTANADPGDLTPRARAPRLDFVLDRANEATEPPEARGLRRDGVRLLVSPGTREPVDARFTDLGGFLAPGDLLVVNTSATIPAALDGLLRTGRRSTASRSSVHLSGGLPGDVWLVEVRQPRRQHDRAAPARPRRRRRAARRRHRRGC